MSEPTKVYLVGTGEYSDYGIIAAFSSETRADEVAELVGGEVESYTLDPQGYADPGIDFFMVEVKQNRESETQKLPRISDDGDILTPCAQFRTHADDGYGRKSYWRIYWKGYAKSEEHAVREINEIRRQILAGQRPAGVDMGKN